MIFSLCVVSWQLQAGVVNITQGSTSGYTMTDGNTYVVQNSVTFSNSTAGGSGMSVADNAMVVLYIPAGVTLTARGANGSGRTGGGAGILVPETATLIITGEGSVNATGGNAGNGGNGANGSKGTEPSARYGSNPSGEGGVYGLWSKGNSGPGGKGGNGGGGAGAAIGGNGSNGGNGGNGASARINSSYVAMHQFNGNGIGGAAGTAGSNGIGMGVCYVLGNASIVASGGGSGSSGTAGGFADYNFLNYYHQCSDYYIATCGGGGGGGGGAGKSPVCSIGGGGSSGGGGGGGGSGATAARDDDRYDSYPLTNAHGGGGYGGASNAASGKTGTGKEKTKGGYYEGSSASTFQKTYYYGGDGGAGGAAGAEGGAGTLYVSPTATVNVDRAKLSATTHSAAQYTITFGANGGELSSSDKSLTATLGCELPDCIPTPTRGGYIFEGWRTATDEEYYGASGAKSKSSYSVVGNVTLYACWKKIETATIDGRVWTCVVSDDGFATIGNGVDVAVVPAPTGDVAIPNEIGGYPIVGIGGHAFAGCAKLVSIILPRSIGTLALGANVCDATTEVVMEAADGCYFGGWTNATGVIIADPFHSPTAVTVSPRWMNAGAEYAEHLIFFEDFERESIEFDLTTVGTFPYPASFQDGMGVNGSRGFGFGRSSCNKNAWFDYVNTLTASFKHRYFITRVEFDEMERYGNTGSSGNIIVNRTGDERIDNRDFCRMPYNDGVADTEWRHHDTEIGKMATNISFQVVDITGKSEAFIDNVKVYGRLARQCAVSFDANGGSGHMAEQSVLEGDDLTLADNSFERAGYTFLGWSVSASGDVAYGDGATISAVSAAMDGMVLHAAWEQIIVLPTVAVDAAPEAVTNAIEMAGFADAVAIKEVIGGSAMEYGKFKEWAQSVKRTGSSSGAAAGEAVVVANTNAATAYLLGAERLFENAPKVEFGEVSVADGEGGGLGTSRPTMMVSVTVKDGEEAVTCAAEKVKEMFEATSNLGDWNGAAKLTPTVLVDEGEGATMRFKVALGDGTATQAFLRIRK